MSGQPTTIDLLRHGACEGGAVLRGSSDHELSAEGWQQMTKATARNPGWNQVISSPLKRCRLFAEHLAGHLELPFAIDDNWRELHFGDWEGQLIEQLWRQEPDQMRAYFADPECTPPPGGETVSILQQRLQQGLNGLLANHQGEHVLVVQHAGTIKFLLAMLFEMPASRVVHIDVPHACMTRLRIYRDSHQLTPVLVSHNPEGLL